MTKNCTIRTTCGGLLLLMIVSLPLAAHAAKPGKATKASKEKLVLMPLRVAEEDRALQGAMETALVEGLQQKYEVLSGEQVAQKARQIFTKESRNTAKKECDETRCMQGIAEAFQAELIATANVTKQGGGYFLALSIQNIFDNKVEYSKTLTCEGCNAFKVVDKLKELVGTPAPVVAAPAPEEPQSKVNMNDPESALWNEVQKGNTKDDYEAYLAQYPKGKYIALAKSRLKKLQEQAAAELAQQDQSAWDSASSTATEASYAGYLKSYPQGRYAVLVTARIAKLKKEAAEAAARAPQPGKVFKDCPDCPEMVVIPAGSFDMGSPDTETGRDKDEGPVHRVNIGKAFAMGKTEITVGEFRRFVQASQYKTDAERNAGNANGCYAMDTAGKLDWQAGHYWDNPGFTQTERQPAVCLSWNDAGAYVKWLVKETGKQYRLPTEAEWEYAARGNTGTARYWGDNPDEACRYANVADQSKGPGAYANGFGTKHECNDGHFFIAPVGSYAPNAFGLYDTLGNAWEWTADSYHDSYNGAPSDVTEWQGDGAKRVLRGGSWNYSPQFVRSAFRSGHEAAFRDSNYGFRLARTLP